MHGLFDSRCLPKAHVCSDSQSVSGVVHCPAMGMSNSVRPGACQEAAIRYMSKGCARQKRAAQLIPVRLCKQRLAEQGGEWTVLSFCMWEEEEQGFYL